MQSKQAFLLFQTATLCLSIRRSQSLAPVIFSSFPTNWLDKVQVHAMLAASKHIAVPPSTPKTKNLSIDIPSTNDGNKDRRVLSLDEMQCVLADVGSDLGLHISHVTHLSYKRFPGGNRHWYLKRSVKEKGCLDVTYWLTTAQHPPVMWVSMRGWVTKRLFLCLDKVSIAGIYVHSKDRRDLVTSIEERRQQQQTRWATV